jgi:hypothetical protein
MTSAWQKCNILSSPPCPLTLQRHKCLTRPQADDVETTGLLHR